MKESKFFSISPEFDSNHINIFCRINYTELFLDFLCKNYEKYLL